MREHIKRLRLKKLFNTRDLGGIPTADGRTIAHGKLIRSGKLYKLPDKTVNALKELGVTTVVDLRIFTEKEQAPDTLWEGAEYIHLPVLCTATPCITHDRTMRITMDVESKRIRKEFGTFDNYMVETYRSILFSEEPQQMLKKMLRLIIDNEGCILWHCSGGKDRAGIVAMLVESLLGVDESMILKDFIASARFQRARFFWNRAGLVIAPCSLRLKRMLYVMMAAKPRYLTEPLEEVKAKYGSVREYCRIALGVTDGDVEIMKRKYLV